MVSRSAVRRHLKNVRTELLGLCDTALCLCVCSIPHHPPVSTFFDPPTLPTYTHPLCVSPSLRSSIHLAPYIHTYIHTDPPPFPTPTIYLSTYHIRSARACPRIWRRRWRWTLGTRNRRRRRAVGDWEGRERIDGVVVRLGIGGRESHWRQQERGKRERRWYQVD